MSSIYQRRLELLSAGYARNINIDNIPEDIIIHCAMWMKEEPQISFNKWFSDLGQFLLEMQLTGFAAKVLNHQHIGNYQVKCAKSDINIFNANVEKIPECVLTDLTVSNIYPLNCIAFVTQNQIKINDIKLAPNVSAFDKQQNMICESPWKTFWNFPPVVDDDVIEYDDERVNKYFDEHIDIDDKGFVDIDRWVIAMNETEIVIEETAAKKIFYLICAVNKCDGSVIVRKMFTEFICNYEYMHNDFAGEYHTFMKSCQEKIDFVTVHDESIDDPFDSDV